jgi:NAD(P)H-hydrate epimerase
VACYCRTTITFGLPKNGHFLGEGLAATGTLKVVTIGFPKRLLSEIESDVFLLTADNIREDIPRYPLSVHKGMRGKVLIVAGSEQMMGAGLLATRAALCSGAGLVTLALPESMNAAIKGHIPEAMTLPLPQTKSGTLTPAGLNKILQSSSGMDAIAIGPGLGQDQETGQLVESLLQELSQPLVLDADGINLIAGSSRGMELLQNRSAPTLITPHPGELSRLMKKDSISQIEEHRWEMAQETVTTYPVTLLLKGAATVIAAAKQGLAICRSGHPAMAQGGMGDTLTGILVALLGQKLTIYKAACLGAWLHGRAGTYAAQRTKAGTITAGELILALPAAFDDLSN